jgi:hypothetical protein
MSYISRNSTQVYVRKSPTKGDYIAGVLFPVHPADKEGGIWWVSRHPTPEQASQHLAASITRRLAARARHHDNKRTARLTPPAQP